MTPIGVYDPFSIIDFLSNFVLIFIQSLQRFAKTFSLTDCLITPKRVMEELDVETSLLLVLAVLVRAEDELEPILIVVTPLKTTDVGAKEEQ